MPVVSKTIGGIDLTTAYILLLLMDMANLKPDVLLR